MDPVVSAVTVGIVALCIVPVVHFVHWLFEAFR
jgi:hypothetical protein